MAETSTVARPYAKAAFEYARDHQALTTWSEWLNALGQVVAHSELKKMLSSPTLTSARKVELLIEVADIKLDDDARRFLETLASQDRLAALTSVATQFEALRADHEQRVDVTVVSAYTLEDKQQKKLASALKKRLNREISITTQVDPALLGGVILRAGDTVIDGSVRGRLNRLREALYA
ncbi:ATP synthase F1 subcomplex delta subunit [Franzmannia pantelleriensis]|uniref:ATP synthase subunit delta n=1 Tax=Franzmannia pantelleriensis TaxID=48727 RepID=A0A1G9L5K1_9GAMM|nr:F0F1 ATP synthase subunit delta [Halomonas pantelleriensis]SDL57007.1 ATP synthase F1 subcomplex delta subunit [Halomonas pantelleriensis]